MSKNQLSELFIIQREFDRAEQSLANARSDFNIARNTLTAAEQSFFVARGKLERFRARELDRNRASTMGVFAQ